MADIKTMRVKELTPDKRNANRGTERGRHALESSLREYGAGRSILVDRNGQVIAGNKTLEAAGALGLDNVIVVQTDGTQVVAVQRMGLDLDADNKARMLAYADNRVAELDLDFDPAEMAIDLAAGMDFSVLWSVDEVEEILDSEAKTQLADAGDTSRNLGDTKKQIKPVLYAGDVADFERAIRSTGEKARGEALMRICRFYLEALDGDAKGQHDAGAQGLFAA